MDKQLQIIGAVEHVSLPTQGARDVPARIDTGAKTSSVWASGIKEENGTLHFYLFGKESPYFTGERMQTTAFETRIVASSNGAAEERYVVKLSLELQGRKIRASFSLANRSSQAYPVLIGRNVLRGKFLVDVKQGLPKSESEKARSQQLQSRRDRNQKEQA